jgi:hypothetical protein
VQHLHLYNATQKYFSISHHKINYLLKLIAKYRVPRDVIIKIKAPPGQSSTQFSLKKGTNQDMKPFSLLTDDGLALVNAE